MSLHIHGRLFADVELGTPLGQSGLGCFRLLLPIRWTFHSYQESSAWSLSGIGGRVEVSFPNAPRRYLGLLSSSDGRVSVRKINGSSLEHTQHFLELDRARIEAIEACRDGKDLVLNVSLWAKAVAESTVERAATEIAHHIEQGSWVRILGEMEYRRSVLLEVPVPNAQASPALFKAVAALERAQLAHQRGEYRDSVAACRDVLEELATALQESDIADSRPPSLPDNRNSWTKEHRWENLRDALRILTHAAKHADQYTSGIAWNRADATTAIAIVAAELRRCIEVQP